jgi:hypothetical protein
MSGSALPSGRGDSPMTCATGPPRVAPRRRLRRTRRPCRRIRAGGSRRPDAGAGSRGRLVYSRHERSPDSHARRPAPAAQGRARGELRQAPPPPHRRPHRHDARRPGGGPRGAAARRGPQRRGGGGRRPAPGAGQPADRPGRGRRPRPGGVPLDPGVRGLCHAARARLAGGPEPSRPQVQGRRRRPPGARAAARAGPPAGEALYRLPRLAGRPDPGRQRQRRRRGRRRRRARAPRIDPAKAKAASRG